MKSCSKKYGVVSAAVFVAAMSFFTPSVKAEEIQLTGPLAGAPAVRHLRRYRAGRVRLMPLIGFTLQDEFTRTMMLGGELTYNITDWLGIGAWGGFGLLSLDTDLTDQIKQRGQTTDRNRLSLPSRQNFDKQIGQIKWAAFGQAVFTPLRGKLSLFQKLFVDTDFYVFGGAGFVGVEERADVDGSVCAAASAACSASQTARASRAAFAPTFGAGLTFYTNNFVGLSLEWRAMPFAWNGSGTDESGLGKNGKAGDGFPDGKINQDDRLFQFHHMAAIGAAFYLPTSIKIGE